MKTDFIYPCMPLSLAEGHPRFEELDNDPGWVLELKLNGWRCLIQRTRHDVVLWTRNRKIIYDNLEDLRPPLFDLPPGTLIDAELVAFRTVGIEPALYLFDVIRLKHDFLNDAPFSRRRAILEEVMPKSAHIILPEQIREDKKNYYDRVTAGSVSLTSLIEGVVLKELNSPYPISRTRSLPNPNWLKVKPAALIEKQKEEAVGCPKVGSSSKSRHKNAIG